MKIPNPIHVTVAASLLAATSVAQVPNVLLVIADDVGVDGIGSYGYPNAAPTPNLDALARRGVRFLAAHACPVCSPTRASLLTGRHAFRTGVGAAVVGLNADGLPAAEVTLPEILGPNHVTTGLFGKWHLGTDRGPSTPTVEGFDVFTGSLGGQVTSYYQWTRVENRRAAPATIYATIDATDAALAFIATTATPWFAVVSYNAAHTPFEAPPAQLHTQDLTGLDPVTSPVPFYKAMVEAMDTEIGRLLAGIPAATLANTDIVFVGDNGTANQVVEPPFDPTRSKGTVYQGGVRVPMIVAGPIVGGGARTEAGLVHVVDLFPTIAELQGVDARAAVPASVPLDGVSFVSLLRASNQPPTRQFVYSQEFAGAEVMTTGGDSEVIRDERYELLRFRTPGGIREELYDLVGDPWEANDLLRQPLSTRLADAYRELWRELARLRGLPSVIAYGSGCSGAGVSPVLAATTDPVIGATFRMGISGLSAAVGASFGGLGFDDEQWPGGQLPWDMTPIGSTNCTLLVAPAITEIVAQSGGVATWDLALPNSPDLVGRSFFTQGFVLVAGANPAGVLATGALDVVIGD